MRGAKHCYDLVRNLNVSKLSFSSTHPLLRGPVRLGNEGVDRGVEKSVPAVWINFGFH